MGDDWSSAKVNLWWIALCLTIIGVFIVGALLDIDVELVVLVSFGIMMAFLIKRKWH